MASVTVEALFWRPSDTEVQRVPVAGTAQVDDLARALLAQYQPAGVTLPGVELRRHGHPETLSIAIAPDGWALIHTDSEFDQKRTVGERLIDDGSSVDVRWEETTPIPRSWFIPIAQASLAATRWLTDGSLAEEIGWSDDCA